MKGYKSDVKEASLVRDLLYVFQGIDGQNISFSILEDAYVMAPNVTVSDSVKKIICEMCEMGWLYKKVNDYMVRNIDQQYNDYMTQSLCYAIQSELQEYYRLLALLENQKTLFEDDDPTNYLNLRKLYLWI